MSTELNIDSFSTKDNISLSQERTRSWLAKGLFWAVIALIALAVILAFFTKINEVILGTAVSGFMGLLGTVIGFYFGSKS